MGIRGKLLVLTPQFASHVVNQFWTSLFITVCLIDSLWAVSTFLSIVILEYSTVRFPGISYMRDESFGKPKPLWRQQRMCWRMCSSVVVPAGTFPSAFFPASPETLSDVTCVLLNQIQLWQHAEHTELRSAFSSLLLLFLVICLLLLSCLTLPFTEVYGSCFLYSSPGEHVNDRNVYCEMWCWAATACGLDKIHAGRRRFWVMSEKCRGVLHTCLALILLYLLEFSSNRAGDLCCCSVNMKVCHKSLTSGSVFISAFCSSFSCLSHPRNIHIRIVCVCAAVLVSVMMRVSLVHRLGH